MELGKEKDNERSEEQGQRRDGEAGKYCQQVAPKPICKKLFEAAMLNKLVSRVIAYLNLNENGRNGCTSVPLRYRSISEIRGPWLSRVCLHMLITASLVTFSNRRTQISYFKSLKPTLGAHSTNLCIALSQESRVPALHGSSSVYSSS